MPTATHVRSAAPAQRSVLAIRVLAIRVLSIAALALIALYAYGLLALYGQQNGWLIDESGQPRSNEYVGVRAAGQLALDNRAAAAYDWAAHEKQAAVVIGRPVNVYMPYPYPPTYLFFAAGLAALPFLWSALLLIVATLALYAWSVAQISGARIAALWAIASPPTVFNVFVAHTGFWSAALTGLALDALPKRPVLAGVLFGLLTLKPQLGLLLPVALVAGGYWRTIGAATATVAMMVLISLMLFGAEPWGAFVQQMGVTSEAVRFGHPRTGDVNMTLLVSAYGCLRSLGVPDGPAIILQMLTGCVMAAGVAVLWRGQTPFALKAAGLVSASLLVTPYLFIYDLTHLSIALAFLVQHTGLGGLSRGEVIALGGAIAMILLTAFVPLPFGFVANAFVAVVIVARVWPTLLTAGQPSPMTTGATLNMVR
jgi:arabinofuranan 3-O-arabinosyltransferase